MIFDQPPAELPVATLRPRETGAQLLLDVRGWLVSKWRWLRPRSIPVAVAFAGMLGVLASASYLRELAHQPPTPSEPVLAPVLVASPGDEPVARLRAETHACGARMRARPALAATVVTRGEAVAPRLAPAGRFHLEPVVAPSAPSAPSAPVAPAPAR